MRKTDAKYTGTVSDNIRKLHVAIDTGVKQTESYFNEISCYFNVMNIISAFECIFEDTLPILSKFLKSYLTRPSQEPIPSLVASVILVLLHHNAVTNINQICHYVISFSLIKHA